MKATIPLLLLLSATLGFAEPAATGGASSPSEPPHAESAESAEPAATGGASSPSEPTHAETAEPAAPGGASSPSEPPHAESAEPKPHAESAEAKPHAESAESAEAKPHAESAESKPHAEPAENAEPAAPGGASSPSEPKPHAESAEAKPHAESAESAEAKPHAEPAENAEPAAPGGASSPSEPPPHAKSAEPDSSRAAKTRAPAAARPASRGEPRSPCRAKPQVPRPPLRAVVSLIDGSTLKGTLRQHALPARSPNLGDIRVRLGQVESIAFGKPGAPAKIAFKNGDALSAKFPADRAFVTMDTLVGRVRVPFDKVVSLSIERPHSALSTQHSALLYHCTFDSQAAVERPAAGPAGKFLRGSFVPGRNGRALRVEADTPAFESKLPKGFLGPEGCLEFWAKIEGDDPRYVDGGDPLFVSLYDERGAITLLQFAANNGFARGGLGGAFVSWPFGTVPHYAWSMEYRKVLGENWAGWHHYAMSWKAGGFGDGSFAKVFVDGRPQPVLGGVDDDKLPARLADYAIHAHDLGIPWSAARSADHRRSKKPFLVDDLRIWSVAKTDFAVSSAPTTEPPKLLYHCTFDDAQSVERPAAGPNGRFLGGEFVPGKVGNALFVKAGTPAAEVPFPTGLMQPQGCIEFWGKIPGATKETTFPDGGNPQFFAMGVGKWVNTFVKYTANDGFGTGGLHANLPGSAYVSTLPSWSGSARYPEFLGDPSAWHHYALVWSDQGLDAASEMLGRRVLSALYVDGRLVNPSYGHNGPDRANFFREFVANPVVLGFPYPRNRNENNRSDVDFLIDDFKIWSAPKTDFGISAPSAAPRLLYHCTFDDASAIESPATGPSGTFLGGTFEEGKSGNALRVRKGLSSAIVHFDKGMLQPRGTIEFWAKIENDRENFGDGGDPRFFMLETAPGSETVFQLAANDGCGRGGLSIYHQGYAVASGDQCLYPANYKDVIPGDAKGWHHYVLVWDENGVPGLGPVALAAFVDGKRIPLHGDTGLAGAHHMASRLRDNPATLFFSLNPELNRGFNNRTDFLIDEFKIWSVAKPPRKAI